MVIYRGTFRYTIVSFFTIFHDEIYQGTSRKAQTSLKNDLCYSHKSDLHNFLSSANEFVEI